MIFKGTHANALYALAMVIVPGIGCQDPEVNKKTNSLLAAPETSNSVKAAPPKDKIQLRGAVKELPAWLQAEAPDEVTSRFKTIPQTQNAAPLYCRALLEFRPTIGKWMEGVDFSELQASKDRRYERFMDVYRAWLSDPESLNSDAHEVVSMFDRGVELIRTAQELSDCTFETGLTITASLSHLEGARAVAQVLRIRAALLLESGDLDGPIESVSLLLRLYRDLQPRGIVISQELTNVLANHVAGIIKAILGHSACSRNHCDRLLALLTDHESQALDRFSIAAASEYVSSRILIHEIHNGTGDFSREGRNALKKWLNAKGASTGQLLAALLSWNSKTAAEVDRWLVLLSDEDYRREEMSIDYYYSSVLSLASKSHPDRVSKLQHLFSNRVKSLALALFASDFSKFSANVSRGDTDLRGSIALVALKRFLLERNHGLPGIQAVLASAGVGMLNDPFSGGPFQLVHIDGEPVIYSIGADLKDDGGLLVTDWPRTVEGDIVFSLTPN